MAEHIRGVEFVALDPDVDLICVSHVIDDLAAEIAAFVGRTVDAAAPDLTRPILDRGVLKSAHAPIPRRTQLPDRPRAPDRRAGRPRVPRDVENNAEERVTWITSYVTPDRRKSFCAHDGPTADAIRRAATANGLPVDAVRRPGP